MYLKLSKFKQGVIETNFAFTNRATLCGIKAYSRIEMVKINKIKRSTVEN
jgi:hypothetical protein